MPIHWRCVCVVLILWSIVCYGKKKKRFVDELNVEQELIDLRAEFEAYKASYIAGKAYDETGGSSDSLCLPTDPSWANYTAGHDTIRASLYGTEIDLIDPGNTIFGKHVWEEDLPCAVCVARYPMTLMVPARTSCYPGWTLQYTGYLASNYEAHKGSYDTICLDGDPDFVPHGNKNDNQHVIYVTEVHCGSLPCPPYVENREVACSVCSK